MPFKFTGQVKQNVAKLGIVSDGGLFTVADGYGYTVTSTLSPNTAFAANPVRSGVGVWSVTLKDSYNAFTLIDVKTVLPSGSYLGAQLLPVTVNPTTSGSILNWVFNSAGTPTDLPVGASGFGVLAGSGITNTGATVVNGDIGSYPTATETGFPPGVVNGNNHGGDSTTQAAKTALTAQYNAAQALPGAVTIATDLNGQTLTPGVYSSLSGTFSNSGTVTFNGAGNYTFQMATTLVTSTSSKMLLTNGATAANITWAVGSSATLGVTSTLVGSVLALTSITADTGAVVNGRLLAQNGAVTLAGNTVTVPVVPGGVAGAPQFIVYFEASESSYN
jgi:hypothetical protein